MRNLTRPFLSLLAVSSMLLTWPALAAEMHGRVATAQGAIADAAVTLWVAGAGDPQQVGQTHTGADGGFVLNADTTGGVLYVTAKGGHPAGKEASPGGLVLLAVLGERPPGTLVVNELTTVASAFTAAQFLHGEAISGNPLGLRIAAGNVPNFVDLRTGKWGHALLDPLNSTQTATLATFDTLGALVTAFAAGDDAWRARFLKAATPGSGAAPSGLIDALADIAREPWTAPKDLFALFDEAYPQPKDGSRRAAPFLPYLALVPPDFALTLCFAGGGMLANGRFMFDQDGNLWSGQNWMPGSQSGVNRSIGGGVVKMAPNGTALSPPITGFTGMGLDGVGWGTLVTADRVWISGFNGKILVMDLNGHPVAKESDVPFKNLFGLMGIAAAPNGDIWVADGADDQLLLFPGGRLKDGRIVKVAGLASPFDIIVDPQNRVWVSNSQAETVLRFPADDPSKVETFHAGLSVRALALDEKGNLWVASNASPDLPLPKMPPGISIMEQFKILAGTILRYPKPTGIVSMFRPDGEQPSPKGYDGGGAIDGPWGINIDGNGDVWVGTIKGRSVVLLAGDGTKGHPAGTRTGDLLHVFTGGSIQAITDVAVDPAGNVWVANNWNSIEGATAENPPFPVSTWGGGSGLTVIYGVAGPVRPPRIGLARPN
ncbi:MAG: hypothetical protein JSR21_05955 [Proteobacteria bacterium]|nr:hypothetical protein [Pseudomonadota bacterium]